MRDAFPVLTRMFLIKINILYFRRAVNDYLPDLGFNPTACFAGQPGKA
jgi:hypothetical protein